MKVIGYAFLTLFVSVILREVGFRGARLVSLVGVIGLLGVCVAGIEGLSEAFEKVGQGVPEEYVVPIMKIMGVGYSSGICADMCMEFGELSLSNTVTLLGRIEMIAISAPCALEILEKGIELIG